jgi:DNA polymerase-3 subunit beta
MRLTVNRTSLLEALDLASGVVHARTPKPVLQCVLLTAQTGTLSVFATNLEGSVKQTIDSVQIDSPGTCAIPLAKFREIVKANDADTVSMDASDSQEVKLAFGMDARYSLPTMIARDYPGEPKIVDGQSITVPMDTLHQLIERTAFAAANESTRYAFEGVLLKFKGNKLTAVATDGRRLACVSETVEKVEKEISAIVPRPILPLVQRLESGSPVEIELGDNAASFASGSVKLWTNLLEGTFPPYEDVIPKDTDKTATAGTAALMNAVRRAGLMSNEEAKAITFTFDKNGLVLKARSPDAGEAEIRFPCKYEGAGIEICFNPVYVNDFLKVAAAAKLEEVRLMMSAPNRPGLFAASGNFFFVLMPVNRQ